MGVRTMTTVSLSELLNIRDESIKVRSRPSILAHLRAIRLPRLAPPAWLRPVFMLVAAFVARHILVLSGCASVVTSAAMITPALGWLAAGAALFFLEARRR